MEVLLAGTRGTLAARRLLGVLVRRKLLEPGGGRQGSYAIVQVEQLRVRRDDGRVPRLVAVREAARGRPALGLGAPGPLLGELLVAGDEEQGHAGDDENGGDAEPDGGDVNLEEVESAGGLVDDGRLLLHVILDVGLRVAFFRSGVGVAHDDEEMQSGRIRDANLRAVNWRMRPASPPAWRCDGEKERRAKKYCQHLLHCLHWLHLLPQHIPWQDGESDDCAASSDRL